MILIWEGYMGKLWEGECNSLGPFVSGMSTYKKQQYNIVIYEVNTKETEQGSSLLIFTTNFVESFGSLTIRLYEFDKNKDLKQTCQKKHSSLKKSVILEPDRLEMKYEL